MVTDSVINVIYIEDYQVSYNNTHLHHFTHLPDNISQTSIQLTMTNIDVNVEGLDELVDRSLTRVIEEINPTLEKFQNLSLELISTLETRIKENVSETLYYLETNLFVLLFVMIVVLILILIMFWLLETVMRNFEFKLATRKFIGLIFFTAIFIWLFVATTLATFPPPQPIDLQTLKYILFSVLCISSAVMIFIWIRWICIHRKCIRTFFVNELCHFQSKTYPIESITTIKTVVDNIPMDPVAGNRKNTLF
ncbi:unnamed protein product [Adineta ricciae]|uniref:Uncharacterized protein n=1 Tax=Adineta ricciae TaxID=249248 RepID=A0A815CP72_ADIRI|nr:unnamed protein product [Adineta ricciae]CAF1286250.1 unnamed protein product [Adineta ricciae]